MGGRFLEAYYERNPQTAWDAAAMAARTLGSIFVWGKLARRLFAVTPLSLAVDGRATSITRPRLLVAATVPDMGVGFKVAWQARTVPGQLHVVASELTMFGMGSQSWRSWLQRPLKGRPHLDVLCAGAEVEFVDAHAWLVGEEGRGVPQILAMGALTRLDCALGTAGLMRQALSLALHHTAQRHAFGRPLIAQPLMQNVLADLALESEAATALATDGA